MALVAEEKILFVVVLYKQSIPDSETCQSFIAEFEEGNQPIHVLVYDNSPLPQKIPDIKNIRFSYIHDASNPGPTKAYNKAALLAKREKFEWIAIFDQDTRLPKGFLHIYKKAAALGKMHGMLVYAPLLFDSGRLISPCAYHMHRGFHLKSQPVKNIKLMRRSLLNSGLLLHTDVFSIVGYFDERLFYYSDHDFFYRARRKIKQVGILDVSFQHSLSSAKNVDSPETEARIAMLRKAALLMSKKYNTLWPFFWFLIRSVKLSILNKNLRYLKVLYHG